MTTPGAPATEPAACGWKLASADGPVVPCTAKRAHRIHRNDTAHKRWSETYDHAIPPNAEVPR